MEHGYYWLAVALAAKKIDMSGQRLLIITKHLLDSRDAQAQQSAALISALSASGIKLDIITGAVSAQASEISQAPSTRLYAIPTRWLTDRQNLSAKIARKLERNLTAWLATRWARQAAQLATHLMTCERYDALISIAMPMESHIAALQANRRAPWIACMSDPWPESILPAPYSDLAIPILNSLQKQVVRKTFEKAEALVFPCIEELAYLASHYPSLNKNKAFLIPHVAPSRIHTPQLLAKAHSDITLIHGGALSRERVCSELAQAMGALPEKSRWRLRFVGHTHPEMVRALEHAGAMQRVDIDGWKSKQETLSALSSAQALLLVEARMSSYPFLPSKLADYASTGLPIIAITGPCSPSSRLIHEHNAGLVTNHDANNILQALLSMEERHTEFSSRNLSSTFQANRIAEAYCDVITLLSAATITREAVPSP